MSRSWNRSPNFARTSRSVLFLIFLISFAMVVALWRPGWTAWARGFPTHLAQTLGVDSPSKTNTVNATESCVAPPSGMVAWFPGDGNAHDISGNNNNGFEDTQTAFVAGKVAQAFQFNG